MIDLRHGCCLEEMESIPDNSIDMVLADVPYGTTACKWDSVIPFEPMWNHLKRITKDNGAICLFGSEPFSSHLRLSNLKMFKYDWIWIKNKGGNPMNAKKQPMKEHEIVSIFCNKMKIYYPVKQDRAASGLARSKSPVTNGVFKKDAVFGKKGVKKQVKKIPTLRYPTSYQKFNVERGLHSTQKPVALLEYLIKTYTLENELVLDFTMGSGSTGVACKNLDRNFIGIEKEENYFNIARKRIQENT